jgi:hypothetical protein
MQQQPADHRMPRRLAIRALAVFLAGAAGAYWLSASPTPRPTNVTPTVRRTSAVATPLTTSEEVQSLLAQGGCPGWIALASEPSLEAAGQPPSGVRLAQATAASDDDLISEEEDLLLSSPEVQRSGGKQGQDSSAKSPSDASTAPPTEQPESAKQTPADTPREYTPNELLQEKPLSQQPTPPPQQPQPQPQPSAEELLDSKDDLLADEPLNVAPPQPLPPLPQELLQDRDDLLAPEVVPPGTTTPPPAAPPVAAPPVAAAPPSDPATRCQFIADSLYPSASACRTCHEKIYDEWSVSSHAYAAVSPMFHKFEQKISDLTQGTIGYFCFRCHSPAGTALGVSRAAPIYDAPLVAREGVTCIACHRVNEMYGKTNGERRIVPGDIYAPVYGSIGGDGVAAVAAQASRFKVKTSPHDTGPGQPMHSAGFCFPQLSRSEFCTSCHQVAVYPGIKLEVVWEQYRASPACKKGISCQDCHMGRIPGVPSGYEIGPAAVIDKKIVNGDRKHANHTFYGPGYSIAHPGIFPFNPKAERWSMRDWLCFDWRAGWGTDAFENAVADGAIRVAFPPVWQEADDRYDAREIIDANLKKKAHKDELRAQVMENGSRIEGPCFEGPRQTGVDLKFSYQIANTNEGHNLPTGSLGAQPQLWANVVLIDPHGNRIWETGYLDCLGDLADIHSVQVRHKEIEFDWQLLNLQSMFLITGAKGTDREFFLPVNIDIDPLPFIRPAPQPVSVMNHPPFIRMEARSLAPLGARHVPYRVPGHLLREPGRYRLSFRMRSRTEPMYFMRFCGSTADMMQAMIEGTLDFHQSSVEFDVR